MLPTSQAHSVQLGILVQRSLQLAGRCAYSKGRSQDMTGGKVSRKVESSGKQGETNSKRKRAPSCYVQNFRKHPIQILRVHNPHHRWADFCVRQIYRPNFKTECY
ncbi:hypothetical protein KR054_006811 [Drosophila jambulina]|nr:hypothetical protein KR054_006811 [Drosophila jambulina]